MTKDLVNPVEWEVAACSMWTAFLPTEWMARYIAWKVSRRRVKYMQMKKANEILLNSALSDTQKFVQLVENDLI